MVALPPELAEVFQWPNPTHPDPLTVGEALAGGDGIAGLEERQHVVGSSRKYSGADPRRGIEEAWRTRSRADASQGPVGKAWGQRRHTRGGAACAGAPRNATPDRAHGSRPSRASLPSGRSSDGRPTRTARLATPFRPPVARAVGTQIRRAMRKSPSATATAEIVALEGQDRSLAAG